jgi:hypothetical protein
VEKLCQLTGRDVAKVKAEIARLERREREPLPPEPIPWDEPPPKVGTLQDQLAIAHRGLNRQQRAEVEAIVREHVAALRDEVLEAIRALAAKELR